MAITADWPNYIFHVPRADMTLIQSSPTEIRECNINWLRLQIMALEDDPAGMTFPTVWTHYPEVDVGGLVLAKSIVMNLPYTVTFEDGQYAVNLVGANSNVGDRVNVNQVSVRSANSAGMTSSPDIEYASFNGGVTYDEINGVAGTLFPTGTPRQPVNNPYDAGLIATYRGLTKGYIRGDMNIPEDLDIAGFHMQGDGKYRSTFYLPEAANVEDCTFTDAHVIGYLDGQTVLEFCLITDLNYLDGSIDKCLLEEGTILVTGSTDAHILDCKTGTITGPLTAPTVDMGGSGRGLVVRNQDGALRIVNKTGPERVSVSMVAGAFIVDFTSVTNGSLHISGTGWLLDQATLEHVPSGTYGNFVIQNELMCNHTISEHVWSHEDGTKVADSLLGKAVVSPDDLHATIYTRDDDAAVSHEFDISTDKRTRTPV